MCIHSHMCINIFKYTFVSHFFEDSFHLRERKKAGGVPISDHLFLRFHIGAKGDVNLGAFLSGGQLDGSVPLTYVYPHGVCMVFSMDSWGFF